MKFCSINLITLWVLALSLLVPRMWAFDVEVYLDESDVWTLADEQGSILDSNAGWDIVDAVNASFDHLTEDREVNELVVVRDSGVIGPHDGLPLHAIQIPSFTSLDFEGTVRVEDTGEPLTAPLRANWAESIEILNFHLEGNPRYGIWFQGVKDVHFHNITMDLTGGLGLRVDDTRGDQDDDPSNILLDGRSNNITMDNVYIRGSGGHGVETYGVDGLTIGTVETVDTGFAGLLLNLTRNATVERVYAINAGLGTGYAGFRTANDNGPNIEVGEVIVRGGGRGIFSVSGSVGVTVDWIDIEGMQSHGILLEDADDWHIKGGIIRNTGAQGIRLTSTGRNENWSTTNNVIENVRVVDTREPKGMSHGIQETGEHTSDNQFLNNDVRNSGSTADLEVLDGTVTTGTLAGADPDPAPNAEVYLEGGEWTYENHDTADTATFGDNMGAAVQAAVDSLSVDRTWKERVVVSDGGTVGPDAGSEPVGVMVDSYTVLDFQGTITVADSGDPNIVPIIIDGASHVEIANLHVEGNALHGLWLNDARSVDLVNIELDLDATSGGGSGIRIEQSEPGLSEAIRIYQASVSGSSSHGVEVLGMNNVVIDDLFTADTMGAGLLLSATENTWVRSLEAHNPGNHAGLAVVNGSGRHIRVGHLEVHGGVRGLLGSEGSQDVEVASVHIEGTDNQGILIQDSQGFHIGGGIVKNNGEEGILFESTDEGLYGATQYHHIEYVTVTDDSDAPTQTYGIRESSDNVDNNTYFRNDLRNGGTVADIELSGENSVSIRNTLTGDEAPGQYDAEVFLYDGEWVAQNGQEFVYWGNDYIEAVQSAISSLSVGRDSKESVVVWDPVELGPYPEGDHYVGVRLSDNTILDIRGTVTVDDPIGIVVPVLIEEVDSVEVWNLHVTGTARHAAWVRSSTNVDFDNVHIDLMDIDESEAVHIPPFAEITTAHGNGADTMLTNDSQGGDTGPDGTHGDATSLNHRIYDGVRMKAPMLRFDVSDFDGADLSQAELSVQTTWVPRSRTRDWTVYGLTDEALQNWEEMSTSYANFDAMLDADLGYFNLDESKWQDLGFITVAGDAPEVYTSNPGELDLEAFLGNAIQNSGYVTFFLMSSSDNDAEWSIASKEGAASDGYMAPTLTLPNAIPPDWEPGAIGQAILVDDSWGPRSGHIRFNGVQVDRSMYHGIALHGVDTYDVEWLETADIGGSGLYSYDSHDGSVGDLTVDGGQHGFHAVANTGVAVVNPQIQNTEGEGILIEDSQDILVHTGEVRNAGVAGVHLLSTGAEERDPSTDNVVQNMRVVDDRDPQEASYGIAETGSGSDHNRIINNDLRDAGADADLLVEGENTIASGNWLTGGDQEIEYHAQVFLLGDNWVAESLGEVLYDGNDMLNAVQAAVDGLSAERIEKENVVIWDGGTVGPYEWNDAFKTVMVPSYTSIDFREPVQVDDELGMIIPLWLQDVEQVDIVNFELEGAPRYGIWIQSSSDVHLGNVEMDLVELHSEDAVQGAPVRVVTTADGMGADTYLGNDDDWSRGGPDQVFGGFDQMRLRDLEGARIRLPMMRFDISQYDPSTLTDATLSLNVMWTHGSNPGDMITVYGLVDNSLANWDEMDVTFNNFGGISADDLFEYELHNAQWVELGQMEIGGDTTVYTSDPGQLNLDTFLAGRSGTVTFLLAQPGNESGTRDWDLEAEDAGGENPPTLEVPNAQYGADADIERDAVGYGIRVDDNVAGRSSNIHVESAVIRGSGNHGFGAYGVDGITIESIHTEDTGGAGVAFNDVQGDQIDYLHVRGGQAGFYANRSWNIVVDEVDIAATALFGVILVDSHGISINGGHIANTDGVGVQVESSEGTDHPSTGNTVQNLRIVDDRETPLQSFGIREVGAATDDNSYTNNDLTDSGTQADIHLLGANSVSDGNTLTPRPETWFGWPVDGQHRANAGPMGHFYIEHAPWVYSYNLRTYLYMDEGLNRETGAWIFMLHR